jgi:Txe/YoeB family toxin of Txe-Axe toxin-antitoxin module
MVLNFYPIPNHRYQKGTPMKTDIPQDKVLFMHGFSQAEIRGIMWAIKSMQNPPKDIAFCMSTENNLEWKIKDLIKDVREDHDYLKANPPEEIKAQRAAQEAKKNQEES